MKHVSSAPIPKEFPYQRDRKTKRYAHVDISENIFFTYAIFHQLSFIRVEHYIGYEALWKFIHKT